MFYNKMASESRPIVFLKKAIVLFAIAFLLLGIISSHRAYYQVRNVDLTIDDLTLRPGSVIGGNVTTSGRTFANVKVELVQGTHVLDLIERLVPANEFGFLDPRTQSISFTIDLSREMLSAFADGPTVIRATVHGRPQWTRVPPPVVKEIPVMIEVEPVPK